MSLIEKIDERLYKIRTKISQTVGVKYVTERTILANRLDECLRIKELILSEQKEPLTIGDKIRGMDDEQLERFLKKVEARGVSEYLSEQGEPCQLQATCYTGRPPTKGDKIRENNDSLAEFMESLIHCETCAMSAKDGKPYCHGSVANSCKQRMLDYLNQPYTE